MEQVANQSAIETRRMELRGVVRLAGEVVAQYWPMRTFVHHNPLHSLEYLPFEETVRRGKQFTGGNGYLHSHLYRDYLKTGRIQSAHLEAALKPLALDEHVAIGNSHLDLAVLRRDEGRYGAADTLLRETQAAWTRLTPSPERSNSVEWTWTTRGLPVMAAMPRPAG